MPTDPLFYLIGWPAVFLIGLGKGAFGGGLAIIGIPILALAIDPVDAAVIVAIVSSTTDFFALRVFPLRTWSWPDIAWLAPGMAVGIAIGALFFWLLDPRILVLGIALVTLTFVARYFLRGRFRPLTGLPVQPGKALAYGTLGGFTTFIAHSAAPPLLVYLVPRGLTKTTMAGTLVALLILTNTLKLIPYGWFAIQRPEALWQALALLPAVPLGLWVGQKLHHRLDEHRLYFWCYLLVGVAGLKLLADSLLKLAA